MILKRCSLIAWVVVLMWVASCGLAAQPTPTPTIVFPTLTPPPSPTPVKQWAAPPPMTIDPTKIYIATLKTQWGDIVVQLFADKAPQTVNNFVFLAREGFYDNTTFHRVLSNFMAQGGDPTGTGSGGPGYQFPDEISPDLRFNRPGYLAMANAGPGTNGSQFFITYVATPSLDGKHTIFGQVVEGMDVALSLALRDPQQNPSLPGDTLLSVTIEETTESRLPPPKAPEPEEGRPLAKLDIAARENLYTDRPAMVIDPNKAYTATLTTTKGTIVIQLHPKEAPESVNNFVVLANLGYWDNFPIVYLEPGLFVLTGSPTGSPTSDVGYSLPSETGLPHVAGAVGYWFRSDLLGSSGSEFYIMLAADERMSEQFTVFGDVVEGLDVGAKFETGDRIEKIVITEQ